MERTIAERIAEIEQLIELNRGKRGNTERRVQLNQLYVRKNMLGDYRANLREKMNSQNYANDARDNYHPAQVRHDIKLIAMYAGITRGGYGKLEINYSIPTRPDCYQRGLTGYNTPSQIIDRYPTHPRLAKFAAWNNAWVVIKRANEFGILEDAGITDLGGSHSRRQWSAINHDLYAYNADGRLVIVQQRESASDGKYRTLKIRYFVTDGETAIELQNGKKQLVKRAASANPTPDSPLRALRDILPDDWQAMVSDTPVKFTSTIVYDNGYKLLELRNGQLLSLWNDKFEYAVGQRKCDRARDDHNGGLYYYKSPEFARKLTTNNWGRIIPQFVLVKCAVGGNTVQYGSKYASTYLTPVEILETINA